MMCSLLKKNRKMAIKKRLEFVRDRVQNEFKVDLVSNRRLRELVVARVAFANALRQYYTTTELGKVLDKDHATICHYASLDGVYGDLELYRNIFKSARSAYQASEYQSGVVSKDIFNMLYNLRSDLESLEGMVRTYIREDNTIVYDHTPESV